ncbi:UNVERIFIED_CONTAM: hypothetical protein FKN15_053659 [Acipenser sinensis]
MASAWVKAEEEEVTVNVGVCTPVGMLQSQNGGQYFPLQNNKGWRQLTASS